MAEIFMSKTIKEITQKLTPMEAKLVCKSINVHGGDLLYADKDSLGFFRTEFASEMVGEASKAGNISAERAATIRGKLSS